VAKKAQRTKDGKSEGKTKETKKGKVAKTTKLEQAKKIIAKLEAEGVEVDERVPNKKWMLESNPQFFGCVGSNLVDVDDLIEIAEMYGLNKEGDN
jgi:hypothetical protein